MTHSANDSVGAIAGAGSSKSDARQMLSDAAHLCRRCAGFWRDEARKVSQTEKIIYAIDADIVYLYRNPRGARVWGKVFEQADGVSELVAGLIGDFIFHRLMCSESSGESDIGSLLLIPPHDDEVRGMVDWLAHRQARKAKTALASIPDLAEPIQRAIENATSDRREEILLSTLSNAGGDLSDLLLGKADEAAEMARLKLLPRRRLANPLNHPSFQGDGALPKPPLRGSSSVEAKSILRRSTEIYEKMLERSGVLGTQKLGNLDDDAWVLATLEWLNTEAVRLNSNRRVVLITATQRMHDVAKNLPSAHEGFADFGEAYLRNPQVFMGDRNFFAVRPSGDGDTQFRILEWMAVLFSSTVQQDRIEDILSQAKGVSITVAPDWSFVDDLAEEKAVTNALEAIARTGYRQAQGAQFPECALDEWCDVVRDTHTQVVLQRNHDGRSVVLNNLLAGLNGSSDEIVNQLMDRLIRQVQLSFADLYLTTGAIGVVQLLDSESKISGLPALRFDLPDYQVAQNQCDALADKLFQGNRGESFDLALMYEELHETDDSHYHAHVLHAFVHASAGRWFSARTLCRVALVVVDAIPEGSKGRRTGREAAYLMAVAERRLAVNAAGLSLAEVALNEAVRRAVGHEALDIRFFSEAFAQKVAGIQMKYFLESCGHPDVLPILNEALGLCDQAIATEQIRAARRWVVRQVATNSLILTLIAADDGNKKPQTVHLAREFLRKLEQGNLAPILECDTDRKQLYPDEISDFVWLVATAVFESRSRAVDARRKLEKIAKERKRAGLRYERVRRERFLKLAGCEAVPDSEVS